MSEIITVGAFNSFNELSSPKSGGFKIGHDFDIKIRDSASFAVVIGIHAGKIEKMTSEIVKSIAGIDLSYYLFEGKLPNKNMLLHISSHNYDEPQLQELLRNSRTCVSIHGFNEEKRSIVSIGGQNKELANLIFKKIKKTGFIEQTKMEPNYKNRFFPEAPSNIVNSPDDGGVQIEISKKLRLRMKENEYILKTFSNAIKEAIYEYEEHAYMKHIPHQLKL